MHQPIQGPPTDRYALHHPLHHFHTEVTQGWLSTCHLHIGSGRCCFSYHKKLLKGPTMFYGVGTSWQAICKRYYGMLGAHSKYESPFIVHHK